MIVTLEEQLYDLMVAAQKVRNAISNIANLHAEATGEVLGRRYLDMHAQCRQIELAANAFLTKLKGDRQ